MEARGPLVSGVLPAPAVGNRGSRVAALRRHVTLGLAVAPQTATARLLVPATVMLARLIVGPRAIAHSRVRHLVVRLRATPPAV